MRYNKLNHKYALVQDGYCVFGLGRTPEKALEDALKSDFSVPVYDDDGNHVTDERCSTIDEIEKYLNSDDNKDHKNGSILLIDDPDEIRSYVENI